VVGKVAAEAKLRRGQVRGSSLEKNGQLEFRQEAQLHGTHWYTDKMRISSAFLVSRHRVS